MSNIATLKQRLSGDLAQDIGGQDTVNQFSDFIVEAIKAAADSMASDTTAATKFWCNAFDYNVYVVSGIISPTNTLTAHDTNNAVITVEVDDAANGTPVAALTWTTSTTGTGNWAVDTAEAHTARTASACTVVPGACLHYAIAKGGSGVAVPISRIYVKLRRGEF